MSSGGLIHIVLHLFVPAVICVIFFRRQFKLAYCLMLLALIIDLDHLLASPIYDPERCSIGFHPLHTLPAILGYFALLLPVKTRIFAIGLLIHILLDSVDCYRSLGIWYQSS